MISFYPGPSRVHDDIPAYVRDAARLGIMSINHRSPEFVSISKKTVTLLKSKLRIPKNYTVFFVSSATECWEIIAQNFVITQSHHIFNGSFGEKWYSCSKKIIDARAHPFHPEEMLDPAKLKFMEGNVICLTQNETSNGTQVDASTLRAIRKNNPNFLIAVDATSSMGGIALDFNTADIWFASVQKCFGLPAGLGLLICSPRAIQTAHAQKKNKHYNSIIFMDEMMKKWQTSYTPNVLGIYLLMRVLEKSKTIRQTEAVLKKRYQQWEKFFGVSTRLNFLIRNKKVRSTTVIPIEASSASINEVKKKAKVKGFLLGEGYGPLKTTTFRIANFPALTQKEIIALQRFLKPLL